MLEELVPQSIKLPSGELRLLQPRESAELPDAGAVEWAPIAPYWSVLWRSGVALARELDGEPLRGLRVVELGCGLGAPSLAAARAGAVVLATDEAPEALELVARSAQANGLQVDTAVAGWAAPGELLERAPFDLVLAADVLYERPAVAQLLALLPRLYAGTHAGHPAVEFFRCRELRAECAHRGVACQADGELLGELPALFTIQPRGLRCVTGAMA